MPLATSSLDTIRQKVRRLTRSPSTAQLTNDDLDQYINTFIAYDIPENLRLFDLRKTFTFYTQPNIDTYSTSPTSPTDPLYEFDQLYITVHRPLYIAGYNSMYTQSREQFYGMFPIISTQSQLALGTGALRTFSGTLGNIPILQNNVLFNAVDSSGNGMALVDYPVSNTTGALGPVGLPQVLPSPYGDINYITGAYSINFNVATFPSAPALNTSINVQYVPYVANRPQVMLHFDGTFVMRPIPDQVYAVQFEVYVRPTQLLAAGTSPQLEQWWQYIAYGAAKKILEDRLDTDSLGAILPEYLHQECLALRKTLVQNATQRSSTIYSENLGINAWGLGNWWYNGQGG
jgi:hypothetical protein